MASTLPAGREVVSLRRRIDHIDEKILTLLASRSVIVANIAKIKGRHQLAIEDKEHEQELINRLGAINPLPLLSAKGIKSIWRAVIDSSRPIQKSILEETGKDA